MKNTVKHLCLNCREDDAAKDKIKFSDPLPLYAI
jgi:hypothetical protein